MRLGTEKVEKLCSRSIMTLSAFFLYIYATLRISLHNTGISLEKIKKILQNRYKFHDLMLINVKVSSVQRDFLLCHFSMKII